MSYQDRKDIDNLIRIVDELKYIVGYDEDSSLATSDDIKSLKKELNKYYDSSDVELIYDEFVGSLTKLDTSLRNLLSDLDEFNYALFYLDENNIGLETDLTELKDNLMILLGMLDEFDNHLTGFQGILDAFDLQLNGDETHDGFVDTLQAIQRAIGTENDPQSLKGMLHDFGEALQDIADGDNKLALTLSTLSGYFVAFQGTLREFQQQIEEDLGTATYQAMDTQVINLIYQIANANQELEDHKDSIDDMTDMIGTDSDTLADGTVFGILNNTSDVADEGLRVAGEVSDAIEDEINPALTQINQQDIPNIKNKMGYNSVPQGQTIQSQITAQGNTIGSSSDSASSNTLFGKVKNAQNTADAVDNRVGTSTSTSESTVFGSLNKTINSVGIVQNALGDVSQLSSTVVNEINENIDNIEEVQNGMYKGTGANYNPNATINNPSNGTFVKVINAQVDEAQSTADDAYDLADGADSKATTAQGTADAVDYKVGNVDVPNDGNLATQMNTAQSKILNHTSIIAYMLDPSSNCVLAIIIDNINNRDTYADPLRTKYGFTSNYYYDISQSKYYWSQGSTHSEYTIPSNKKVVGILGDDSPTNYSLYNLMDYIYVLETMEYWNRGNNQWSKSTSAPDFLKQSKLYQTIEENFSKLGHTHSASDLPSTMPPSSHTHGNLKNDGTVGTAPNTLRNVVTDANGRITTEPKPTIPSASTTSPSADTQNGSYGDSSDYARANHTHPKSTLYASVTHSHTASDLPATMPPSAHSHTASDLPSTMPPSSHDHGNLQNGGTIKTNASVTDSNLTGMVVTDSSGRIYIRNVFPTKLEPSYTLKQTITQGNVMFKVYSDELNVYITATGSVTQGGNINLTTYIGSQYRPLVDSIYELDGTGEPHKIILFADGLIRLVTGSGSSTLNLKMSCMYPLKSRLPS